MSENKERRVQDVRKYVERINAAIGYAETNKVVNVFNWKDALKERTVVAFGLGKFFYDTHKRLFDMCDIHYLCDNNPDYWEKEVFGKACISVEELGKLSNVFVIAVVGNYEPLRIQMSEMGIESMHITELHFQHYPKKNMEWMKGSFDQIEEALKLLEDEQSRNIFTEVTCNKLAPGFSKIPYSELATQGEYFSQGIWGLEEQECFLDIGAYSGDTIQEFIRTQESFRKIYAFELNGDNAKVLQENVNTYPDEIAQKIQVMNLGAWDKEDTLVCGCFGKSDGYEIMDQGQFTEGGERCKLVALDSAVPTSENVTVLKMDIEGAEEKALEGSKRIIATSKPKLAICVYHRPDDFWKIPLKIEQICKEQYKYYIRHHSFMNYTDTVLYAYVPQNK